MSNQHLQVTASGTLPSQIRLLELSEILPSEPIQSLELIDRNVNKSLSFHVQEESVASTKDATGQSSSLLPELIDFCDQQPFFGNSIDELLSCADLMNHCDQQIDSVKRASHIQPTNPQPLASVSKQRDSMHSNNTQNEIVYQLSDITKKLDVLIELQMLNNNLLKESLGKK